MARRIHPAALAQAQVQILNQATEHPSQ
jgi:hypothetical protein